MSFVDMPKDKVEELTGQAKQKAADDDPRAQEETDQVKSNLTNTGEKIKDAC